MRVRVDKESITFDLKTQYPEYGELASFHLPRISCSNPIGRRSPSFLFVHCEKKTAKKINANVRKIGLGRSRINIDAIEIVMFRILQLGRLRDRRIF